MSRCTTCGADWARGEFATNCLECGGGAMEIPCLTCGGKCGSRWRRADMDSQDTHEAHWIGGCRLPESEQRKLMQGRIRKY